METTRPALTWLFWETSRNKAETCGDKRVGLQARLNELRLKKPRRKLEAKFKLPGGLRGRRVGVNLGSSGSLQPGLCSRRTPVSRATERRASSVYNKRSFAPRCFQVGFLPPACVIFFFLTTASSRPKQTSRNFLCGLSN